MTRIALPAAIIPFILANIKEFNAELEDGERIIISPKNGATMKGEKTLHDLVPLQKKAAPILRPKFIYRAVDRKLTPDQARKFGFSEPRYLVYAAIWKADPKKGIQSKEIMEQTELPHGTVQQILHWLRKQNMINGEPEIN